MRQLYYFAAVRLQTAVDDVDQGRFAGTVASYQANTFTGLDGEADIIQYLLLAEFK